MAPLSEEELREGVLDHLRSLGFKVSTENGGELTFEGNGQKHHVRRLHDSARRLVLRRQQACWNMTSACA